MNRYMLSLCLGIPLSLGSCASLKDSLLLGISVGAAAGGAIGATLAHDSDRVLQGTAIGATSGALFGALIGYFGNKKNVSQKAAQEGAESSFRQEDLPPSLTRPVVRKVWVPDRIEGDRYERGHWMYQIESQSEWRRDDGK